MLHYTGTQYKLIFGFNISILRADTLFYLLHCILQLKIKYITVKYITILQCCCAYSCGNLFILISIMFHYTDIQYYLVFRFSISVLRGDTLFHFIFISLHPPARNILQYSLQCCHACTLLKSIYIDFHYVRLVLNWIEYGNQYINIDGRCLVSFISLHLPARNKIHNSFTVLPCIYYVEISLY